MFFKANFINTSKCSGYTLCYCPPHSHKPYFFSIWFYSLKTKWNFWCTYAVFPKFHHSVNLHVQIYWMKWKNTASWGYLSEVESCKNFAFLRAYFPMLKYMGCRSAVFGRKLPLTTINRHKRKALNNLPISRFIRTPYNQAQTSKCIITLLSWSSNITENILRDTFWGHFILRESLEIFLEVFQSSMKKIGHIFCSEDNPFFTYPKISEIL